MSSYTYTLNWYRARCHRCRSRASSKTSLSSLLSVVGPQNRLGRIRTAVRTTRTRPDPISTWTRTVTTTTSRDGAKTIGQLSGHYFRFTCQTTVRLQFLIRKQYAIRQWRSQDYIFYLYIYMHFTRTHIYIHIVFISIYYYYYYNKMYTNYTPIL